ncbi:putative transcription factor IIIc-like protein [Pseudozyma hubeiensis]|nr:putative transcription factor IIIc-like protein [Pseudozyma hubeiensis]
MPPKKKQKSASKPSSSSSTSKPTSSSRSTRSRTRSASIVSTSGPVSKPKKETQRKVKAEPQDDVVDLTQEEALPQVWDGEPQMECWVEIPFMPEIRSKEDTLRFIKPKNKEAWAQKGKHKEYADSLVWHVDHQEDADPFYFDAEDMRDAERDQHVVAVRPTTKSGKGSASVSGSSSKKQKSPAASPSASSKPAEASGSSIHSRAPSVSRAASQTHNTTRVALQPPTSDDLEDMFLGSNDATALDHVQDADPLFFEGASDQVDRLRNGTPMQSQTSQRPRVKLSPTYGDRIAEGSGASSSSSTPRPAKQPSRGSIDSTQERNATTSDKGKQKAKDKADRNGEKRKSTVINVDSDAEDRGKGKRKNDDLNNLRSELNEDAFARSTGPRHKEVYRNQLAKFAEARKKARQERGESVSSGSDKDDEEAAARSRRKRAMTVSSGSDTSDSGSDSSDSDSDGDSSSSSTDSRDFIVADDEVEYDEGFQPEAEEESMHSRLAQAPSAPASRPTGKGRYARDLDGRIRLVPISSQAAAASGISSSTSVLAAHGLGGAVGGRKGLDELCLDWIEWAAARVLVTWSSLSLADRERLERNRAALKSRVRSTEESVGSVAMRRQFKWYLTQYPKMETELLFSDEVDRYGTMAKNGCGVCHRKSQKAQVRVTLTGERYNQKTLAPLKKRGGSKSPASDDGESGSSDDSDSDTASDRSDEDETWVEPSTDPESDRPTYTFYAGAHCAQRAVVMHQLHHLEWTTMQTLAKHDSIRYIRRLLWRKDKAGRGKDGKMGCGAWEVALAVSEMIAPTGRCVWGKERGRAKKGTSELERLRWRLKGLNEQAIEVNRAR